MTNINPIWAGATAAFAIVLLLYIILKNPHPIINSIKSALAGTTGIIILSASSTYTGVNIPLNIISIGVAVILGFPGIGTIAILNALLSY